MIDKYTLKSRRTIKSNRVFSLPGGTEDNDLWTQIDQSSNGQPLIRSTWELTPEQRQMVAAGDNIELIIWGVNQPPVQIMLTDIPLGKAKNEV